MRWMFLLLSGLIAACAPACAGAPNDRGAPWPPVFTNYTEMFTFVARFEHLPSDADTLFVLAADSRIDRSKIDGIGHVMVIKADYYGGKEFSQIRGAQDNGRFFVVRTEGTSFRLIGIFQGNGYRWDNVGDKRRLVAPWHMSAAESPETTYTWDGEVFAPLSLSME